MDASLFFAFRWSRWNDFFLVEWSSLRFKPQFKSATLAASECYGCKGWGTRTKLEPIAPYCCGKVCVFCITLHHTSRPIDSTSRQLWPYNFDLAKARHITANGRRLSHAPLGIESWHEIAQQLPTQRLIIYTDSNCRKWIQQHQPARGVFVPSFPTVKFARPI